jgi:hypothetical protein
MANRISTGAREELVGGGGGAREGGGGGCCLVTGRLRRLGLNTDISRRSGGSAESDCEVVERMRGWVSTEEARGLCKISSTLKLEGRLPCERLKVVAHSRDGTLTLVWWCVSGFMEAHVHTAGVEVERMIDLFVLDSGNDKLKGV